MKPPFRGALILLLLHGSVFPSAWGQTLGRGPLPRVGDIIERALKRAKWSEGQNPGARYSSLQHASFQQLDESGRVKKQEERVYNVFPIGGVPYRRLVEKDGRALTKEELEEERKRERNFGKRLAQEGDSRSAVAQISFNENLIRRYKAVLQGIEETGGHSFYVLSFRPKSRNLPVRRQIDRALNKAEGKIWIDTEEYEIFRVEFELTEKVKMWWGILGSLSKVKGRLDRVEIGDGLWFPKRFDLYMKGRKLFRSFHFRRKVLWSEFERVPVEEVSSGR